MVRSVTASMSNCLYRVGGLSLLTLKAFLTGMLEESEPVRAGQGSRSIGEVEPTHGRSALQTESCPHRL